MKNLKPAFIALFLICMTTTITNAQIFAADKTIRGNTVTFKTISISKDSFIVVDSNNELFAQTAKLRKYKSSSFRKRPAYAMYSTFTSVFSEERLRNLRSERALVVNYYVNNKGEILEVTFSLRNISSLTALEIEKLEFEIQRNINFIIPKNLVKGQDLFIITQAVPYRSLFDRTAPYLD